MLGRKWVGIDISPKAAELVRVQIEQMIDLFGDRITQRTDIPKRTDLGSIPNYKTHRHTLYGKQEDICNGCRAHFPFRNFTVDHIIPQNSADPTTSRTCNCSTAPATAPKATVTRHI